MEKKISLTKNFENQLNKLTEKYGEEFSYLNGLSDEQLSNTDFLNKFVDAKVVADASIDGNANIKRKDIVTLMKEMGKPEQKLLAYHKIYLELNQKYGFKTANEWLDSEWSKQLYLHDANTASFIPYCYHGSNIVTIKYHEEIHRVSFEQLYELISYDFEPVFDSILNTDVFYPNDLFVLDIDRGTQEFCWSEVHRVLKHKNSRQMNFIKLSNGMSIIVTDNHPVITASGDISAEYLSQNDFLYTYRDAVFDNSVFSCKLQYAERGHKKPNVTTEVEFSEDFGWLVGFVLAEGSIDRYGFNFKQKSGVELKKALDVMDSLGMQYKMKDYDGISTVWSRTNKYAKWIAVNFGGMYCDQKQLPSDYIHYSYEFLNGILCGFADGDASGGKKDFCFRIASSTLLNQFSHYLSFSGLFPRWCVPAVPNKGSNSRRIVSKLTQYKMSVSLRGDVANNIFKNSVKFINRYIPRKRDGNFENKCYTKEYGEQSVVENTTLEEFCDEVYDITTESGHFICNGILSHNCYAYDLKRLAEEGLFFTDVPNPQPAKHLTTFVDFVKEFISYTSNRTSGAVGLPNIIPYMYYFWKKDIDNKYWQGDPVVYAKQNIQRFIFAVNQPYVRDGVQSAFTNTSVFDMEYLVALFGGSEFPDGTFMVDELDGIMQFQKWYMEEMSDIRANNMMTFPVNTINLLTNKDKTEFMDTDFAEWAIRHNMKWNDSNIFADNSVTSLSNCCRLKSNIKDLGYFNSIGGTSLRVGSVKVSTINLARLALKHKTEKGYLSDLRRIVKLNLQMLDCQRDIIKKNIDRGLLTNYADGLIDLSTQYSTIGVMGIYETMKTFKYTYKDEFGNTFYKDEAFDFGRKIFSAIHQIKDEFVKDKDYSVNLEAVPGEACAVKFLLADSMLFPEKVVTDLPLYGNQFIPLGIKTTIQERVRIASAFDEFCSGGSILHLNIDAPFATFEQAYIMTKYIISKGVSYFAFNPTLSVCRDGHTFYGKKCPVCGKDVHEKFTRIVGFFTPISSWGSERRREFDLREWHPFEDVEDVLK